MVEERTSELTSTIELLRDEITERRQKEEKLNDSEERFRIAFEHALTGMALTGIDGRFLKVNRYLCTMFGYTEQELLTRTFQSITHPDDMKKSVNLLHQMMNGEISTFQIEKQYLHKLGHTVWAFLSVSIVRDKYGNPLYFISHIQDITERKKTEEALLESELKYRMLFENSPLGILHLDKNGVITECNKNACKILGAPKEKLIGFNTMKSVVDEKMMSAVAASLSGKMGYYEGEYLSVTGGIIIPIKVSFAPILSGDGSVAGSVAIAEDITERRKAEEALHESEERYRAFFEQAPDSILLLEANTGELIAFNDKAHENLGYTREEFQKLKLSDIEVIESPEEITRHVEKIKKEGSDTFETKHRTKDGRIRNILVNAQAISFERKIFIQSIWTDITEHKRVEEQVKATLEEKELLLKEIHHRVKNNLQVICSLFNLQKRTIKDKEAIEMLSDCQSRIRAIALVHEKLYRAETLVNINIGEYITDLINNLLNFFEINPNVITLKIDIDNILLGINSAIPCGLIVNELVTNSLQYAFIDGREGEINIEIRLINVDEIDIIVSDNGIGLSERQEIMSTEPLGLQIVNALVRQLKGRIETNRKDGTEFHITFRLRK